MKDADDAVKRASRMWWKLGVLLERHALSSAERGFAETAAKSARLANAAFWQASGEMEAPSLKELFQPWTAGPTLPQQTHSTP